MESEATRAALESSGGALTGLLLFFLVAMLAISLIIIIGSWKIFTKAGKPGWACLIPIYNSIVMLEIVNKPIWWIVLFIIPFVNIIFAIIVMARLSRSFGKSEGFAVGLILLSPIFIPILGFDSSEYVRLED